MEKVVPRFGRWGNVVISFVGLYVASIVIYWLFVDPEIGVFAKTYPQPWFVWFFWYILILAWFGFGGEMWAFQGLKELSPRSVQVSLPCLWSGSSVSSGGASTPRSRGMPPMIQERVRQGFSCFSGLFFSTTGI